MHYFMASPLSLKHLEMCLLILDQMTAKKNFIFSTDSYHPCSIEVTEWLRRGCSEWLLLHGSATRRPAEWKLSLNNDQNEAQLAELLLKVWCSNDSAFRLARCDDACLVVDGKFYKFNSSDGKVSNTNTEKYNTYFTIEKYLMQFYVQSKHIKSVKVRLFLFSLLLTLMCTCFF